MEEVIQIHASDMDSQGRFICPKCKVEVDPDLETEYEVLDVDGECGASKLNSLTIKHKCGQILRLEVINP